jgi:hypothetical protein
MKPHGHRQSKLPLKLYNVIDAPILSLLILIHTSSLSEHLMESLGES